MIFEYIGELEIEPGLIMLNPKMELTKVKDYDLKTNTFSIEVAFWELKNRHIRYFETLNPSPGSLSMDVILNFVTNHPILGLFNAQA